MASRAVTTGFILIDKYLGDALYAAMVYAILRLLWPFASARRIALFAGVAMTAIECFQLTLIPARLMASGHNAVRIAARLMGTEFHAADLAAYAAGIACIFLIDLRGR